MEPDSTESALEGFILDNPELERLESLLDEFNPFVAMRWTRQEIRHSAFLRWLLDPTETHGLGGYALRLFMKRFAHKARVYDIPTPSVVDVDSWDYLNTFVEQEWNNIDIVIRDDQIGFVVALENKVGSAEHSNQLLRYREIVESRFPNHRRFFVYLTIDGDDASDEHYIPVGYEEVVDLVTQVVDRRKDQLSSAVSDFISHYMELLRRHIVQDSEIQQLCQQIFAKHRRALDTLFEHRPDQAQEISEHLANLIRQSDQLILDASSKTEVRFIPKRLDFFPSLGSEWSRSRILLFYFDLRPGPLQFKIIVGPGPSGLREAIHGHVAQRGEEFSRHNRKLSPRWWTFHSVQWINRKQMEEKDTDEIKSQITARFDRFAEDELPAIVAQLETMKDQVHKVEVNH